MPTCTACAAPVSADQRYCGECGAPAPPTDPVCVCGARVERGFCGACGRPRPVAGAVPVPVPAPGPVPVAAPAPWPASAVGQVAGAPPSTPTPAPWAGWLSAGAALVLLVSAVATWIQIGQWGLDLRVWQPTLFWTTVAATALLLPTVAVTVYGAVRGRMPVAGHVLGWPFVVFSVYDALGWLWLDLPGATSTASLTLGWFQVVEVRAVLAALSALVAATWATGLLASLSNGAGPTAEPAGARAGAAPSYSPPVAGGAEVSDRSLAAAIVLAFFLGAFGVHWFYLRRPLLGVLRLVTWAGAMTLGIVAVVQANQASSWYDSYSGEFFYDTGADPGLLVATWVATAVVGVWSLLDIILIATRAVRDGHGRRLA